MLILVTLAALNLAVVSPAVAAPTLESVGEAIFFDTNLSNPPGQACASCHDPATGFADPDGAAVSPGAKPGLAGNRSAPTVAYARYAPPRAFSAELGTYVGGQFWDGRAATLQDQAKQPFLNPLEMNMTNIKAVVLRVAASSYATDFRAVFGKYSLSTSSAKNTALAYDRITYAIAAYERSDELSPFTAKHDYAMRLTGTARLMVFTPLERMGMSLFIGKAQCWTCHSTPMGGMMMDPNFIPEEDVLFSDWRFSNLGIPANPDNPFYDQPKRFNRLGDDWVDHGLAANLPGGVAANPAYDGMFKTPTLRNVALTAPYGHNGYFSTLKEIVHFYNTRDVPGAGWPAPEVPANLETLGIGNLGLTDMEENALVAFMGTFTDGWVPPAMPAASQ